MKSGYNMLQVYVTNCWNTTTNVTKNFGKLFIAWNVDLPVSKIFRLNFRTVSTVWYFLLFIVLHNNKKYNLSGTNFGM